MIEEKDLKLPNGVWSLISERASDIHHAKHPEIMMNYELAEAANNKIEAEQILMDHVEKSHAGIKTCAYKVAKEINIDSAKKEIAKIDTTEREIVMETLKNVIKIDEISLQKIHDMIYSSENYDVAHLIFLTERDGSHTLLIVIFALE